MKEFKRKLHCTICNEHMYCKDKAIFELTKEAWDWEHEACEDMKYILNVKIFKGGDSTWIL